MLLSIAAAKKSLAPIQLQRSLYLLGQQYSKLIGPGFYSFRTISSGQFSEGVYADADELAKKGLVSMDVSETGQREYRVTAAGLDRARSVEKSVSPEIVSFLRRTGAWVRTRSVDQLVRGPLEPAAPELSPPRKPVSRPQR
jgi:hypothetical protein